MCAPYREIWIPLIPPEQLRVMRVVISGDILVGSPSWLSPLRWPQQEPGMPKKGWGVYTVNIEEAGEEA